MQKRVRHGHSEYQIHFKGYPPTHLQWEPLTANNRHTWESDWHLLRSFDPSVGPFSSTSTTPLNPPITPTLRRSTRQSLKADLPTT